MPERGAGFGGLSSRAEDRLRRYFSPDVDSFETKLGQAEGNLGKSGAEAFLAVAPGVRANSAVTIAEGLGY